MRASVRAGLVLAIRAASVVLGAACSGTGEGSVPSGEVVAGHAASSAGPAGPTEAAEPAATPEDDAAELALLNGLTATLTARDVEGLKQWLSPELAAELRRQHDADPAEFWTRGAVWTELAATGLSLAGRQRSDGFTRWRGLVRFGSGAEESVTFGRFDGRVLLADL
jgi:hypothetical protein